MSQSIAKALLFTTENVAYVETSTLILPFVVNEVAKENISPENGLPKNQYLLTFQDTSFALDPDTQIGRVSFNGIQVKHKLVNSSDNITDYAPKDVNLVCVPVTLVFKA